MSFVRKRLFASQSGSSEEPASTADRLQAEIEALEGEMAESMRVLADAQARVAAAEARAIAAVRAGDDSAARAALLATQADAERVALIEADLKVLRAILDECHEFARAANSPAPRP
jgi:hypothetical protein